MVDFTKYKSIVYVATHGLGDLIMSVPAIDLLRSVNLDFYIVVKGEVEKDFLVDVYGLDFNKVFVWKKGNSRTGSFIQLACALFRLRGAFVIPQYGLNFRSFLLLSLFLSSSNFFESARRLWIANKVDPTRTRIHKVRLNKFIIKQFISRYELKAVRAGYLDKLAEGYCKGSGIAVLPSSGEAERHKRWPMKGFAWVMREIRKHNPVIPIYILGSRDEEKFCLELADVSGANPEVICGDSISVVFERLLRDVSVCISNCNGLAHLASLAGCYVVGAYGPTSAEHTGPAFGKFSCVRTGLTCSPCYSRENMYGCGNPVCLTDLSPDEVFRSVAAVYGWSR